MSSVEDWQPGVLSGKPELWNWSEMWKPCGPSLGNSGQSSGTVVESGQGLLVNSASRTSGSASSWLRWDGPGPWRDGGCHTGPQLGGASQWTGWVGDDSRPSDGSTVSPLPRPPGPSRNFSGSWTPFGGNVRLRSWQGQS